MVRFIIPEVITMITSIIAFTFQYGQIYYDIHAFFVPTRLLIYIPIWLDLLLAIDPATAGLITSFTFQYGQIYYGSNQMWEDLDISIYIPIWLDLLLNIYWLESMAQNNLHSNMVRFIINGKI